VCPTPHSPFAPQLPSSFLNSILLPICIELRYIAGPLPSTLLLAISQGTWNHDHQLQHHSASAAGSSEFAPKSTTQPRGESAPFFLSSGPFLLPNDLCGNSDRWATSAGQNGRTPKASEDQGRQVYSFLSRLFLIFLQCSRIFCCQKTMSSFSSRNQHLRILWIPVHFPGPPNYSGSPGVFFLVLSFTPCQWLYHVTCPPVTGFHPRPRRNMACGR
jgi:hypothetical protein